MSFDIVLIISLLLTLLCCILFFFYLKKRQEVETLKGEAKHQTNYIQDENRQLIQELKNYRENQSAESAFYAKATHEMRSSVHAILGMTEIAKKNGNNPGRLVDCHYRIESSAVYLSSLIENISAYSQMLTDTIPKHTSVNLIDFLEQCIADKAEKGMEQDVTVAIEGLSEFSPPQVTAITPYLSRIFSILLDNGIQYNKAHGKVVLKPEVLSSGDETVLCRFSICDSGIGISDDFLTQVFEPFTREHAKLYASWHNTGLSLAIAKQMVEAMHGTIEIDSAINVGTNVILTLPFAIDRNYNINETDYHLTKTRILLTDGNSLSRNLIGYQFGKHGLFVEAAYDGRVAVNKFERSGIDYYQYIFLDADIPIMNAIETISAIRTLSHPDATSVKIVVLSRHTLASDREPFIKAGADHILEKPLDIEKAIEWIKEQQERKGN